MLGLSREESGVLGDGVPGSGNADGEEEDEGKSYKGVIIFYYLIKIYISCNVRSYIVVVEIF